MRKDQAVQFLKGFNHFNNIKSHVFLMELMALITKILFLSCSKKDNYQITTSLSTSEASHNNSSLQATSQLPTASQIWPIYKIFVKKNFWVYESQFWTPSS